MKRAVFIIICVLISAVFCGCSEKAEVLSDKIPVTVNMPKDDTVNGYRLGPKEDDGKTVPGNKVSVSDGSTDTVSKQYCANKNSKIFHSASCTSVKDIKDSNKVYSSDRQSLINRGYKPCQRCNP